jgi:hypothetical protein
MLIFTRNPLASNVYVWQNSFDVQLQIYTVTWRFQKTKRNVNWRLHFPLKCHLYVTCLEVRVISNFNMSIDVWFFFFTSHTTSETLIAHGNWLAFFVGASFCMSNVKKLAKTLLKIYIACQVGRDKIVQIKLLPNFWEQLSQQGMDTRNCVMISIIESE